MNNLEQMSTVIECRKMASFYRTRNPGHPLSRQEQLGLAGLLGGIADLVESLSIGGMPTDNVISFARAQR